MKHPKGIYAISIIEMWERFSFFIFSGLLVLYMMEVLHFSMPFSNFLYGIIIGACYLLQLLTGYLTDKYLGNRKAIILGGTLMIISQLIFTYDASLFNLCLDVPSHSNFLFNFPESIFLIGVVFLSIGASFFKVSVTSFVSLFYRNQEELLDSAYTLFYMLSNIGSFLAPMILGFVVGVNDPSLYQYGFLIGVITIALGMINYFYVQNRYLCLENGEALGVAPIFKTIESEFGERKNEKLSPIERDRVKLSIAILFIIVVFYIAVEQTSTSFIPLTMDYVDNFIPAINFTVTPEMYICLNSLFVIILSPIFIKLMFMIADRNKEPSSISKLSIGLFIETFAFMILLIPIYFSDAKIHMIWIVLFNMLLVIAELFIMPIALSLISKLAPVKHASLMIGSVYGATAVSEVLTGFFASAFPISPGETNTLFYIIPINNLASFIWIFIIMAGLVFILWTLSRNRIKKLSHGVD